jgi:hypothetical protein
LLYIVKKFIFSLSRLYNQLNENIHTISICLLGKILYLRKFNYIFLLCLDIIWIRKHSFASIWLPNIMKAFEKLKFGYKYCLTFCLFTVSSLITPYASTMQLLNVFVWNTEHGVDGYTVLVNCNGEIVFYLVKKFSSHKWNWIEVSKKRF